MRPAESRDMCWVALRMLVFMFCSMNRLRSRLMQPPSTEQEITHIELRNCWFRRMFTQHTKHQSMCCVMFCVKGVFLPCHRSLTHVALSTGVRQSGGKPGVGKRHAAIHLAVPAPLFATVKSSLRVRT